MSTSSGAEIFRRSGIRERSRRRWSAADDQDREVCQHLAAGHTFYAISKMLGISRYRMNQVRCRLARLFRDARVCPWQAA